MALPTVLSTNLSPLKRSFDHVAFPTEPNTYCNTIRQHRQNADRRSLSVSTTFTQQQPHYRYTKRRTHSTPSANSMLAQSPTIMSASFPSFMSVYGSEDNNSIYSHAPSEHDNKPDQFGFVHPSLNSSQPTFTSQPRLIERRGSPTSTVSYSTESSPATTTSSTFDSPLMAEQTPDSSPESATATMPPKSFRQPVMRSFGTQTVDFPERRDSFLPMRPAQLTEQTIEEPKRNLKNLTLDMKLTGLTRPDSSQTFSAPTSPLREAPRTGRKKPTNLTIRTPSFNQMSFGANALAIPPTPGHKIMLHQAQSSPSLPALASPTRGPPGGMQLTLPNISQTLKRDSFSGTNGANLPSVLPSLREEPYQPPKSQETPERGYTEGPCLIYDSGVYLYLEPTAEEAAKFDTVINVAKEITCPFASSSPDSNTVMSVWRNAGNRQHIPEPQTAMSEISFRSAVEWPSSDPTTPTTPRPASSSHIKKPEYLHVRWDHNSEILEDLYPLCRLIDERVQTGKKVLVHCQLGVSRSASLIIAYGLYKGYELNFHSMYMNVKKRSRWVGPNMSLIYQLTDFKAKVDKGMYADCNTQPNPEWFVLGAQHTIPAATLHARQHSKNAIQVESKAESRASLRLNKDLPPVPLFPRDHKPSPAEQQRQITRPVPLTLQTGEKPAKRSVSRGLPFREMGYSSQEMAIPPHRPRGIPGLTFVQPSMDLAMNDVPAAPSLFSPRATEFMASPFGVTTAGDLATTTPKAVVPPPPPGAFPGGNEWRNSLFMNQDVQAIISSSISSRPPPFDPRSPHQQGESKEILRSIDDVL